MADREKKAKQKALALSMEDEELRSLRIPSSAHRGNLSPSKNSFLPTLQEQAQDRAFAQKGESGRRRSAPSSAEQLQKQRSLRPAAPPEQQVLANISAELLESVKQDFVTYQGALDLEQFTRAMLRALAGTQAEDGKEGKAVEPTKTQRTISFNSNVEAAREPGLRTSDRAVAVIDLFRHVDVHGEGSITWDDVSNYLIEQGMAGSDEFTVDSVKTYEASSVVDQSKHEHPVEKLVYLEQIDSVVAMSHNSRSFRLYDPKRCTVRHEVPGHRGTVVNCCYVDGFSQVATTSADMTICLWDSTSLGLRNRMSTKDVQLCLQWDPMSGSLFSGSIDGTLTRWDLQNMCLADTRSRQHKKAINDLLMIKDISLLASASSDGAILMWDTATMKPKKTFKGHKKGTYSLAYSMDYHCLLTAGLDQEALVWNPYVERVPIFRLKGHTHALCGVEVVPGTPQILSADVAGTFRLWDMRNFRCVQSFGGNDNSNSDLNSFCAMPPHRRLAAGGNKVTMYEYMDEWGGESVTDTGGVTDALYNPNAGEFYTVSKQSLKAWNASSGSLFKVLRDVAKSEITAACLCDNGHKLYLGDSSGRIAAHALHNGAVLTEFERHRTDISCLAVWKGTNKLFSSSWDGVVKVHTDERSRAPQMKAEFQHHRDGVTCMACSPELMLLATGGTDMQVNLYDLKTLKLEHQLARLHHVIVGIDFLSGRCMLAVADQGGTISLWRCRPHPDKWQRIFYFRNSPSAPVCSLRFAPADLETPPWLYTADAKGHLRCWDLSLLCERRNLQVVDLPHLFEQQHIVQLGALARGGDREMQEMPLRVMHTDTRSTPSPALLNQGAIGDAAPDGVKSTKAADGGGAAFLTGVDVESEVPGGRTSTTPRTTTVRAAVAAPGESGARQGAPAASPPGSEVQVIYEAEAHSDAITGMYITLDPPAIITCSHDRRVRTWNLGLERLGGLLQNRDPAFRFPYDPEAAEDAKLREAAELLERLGPLSPGTKLPALPAATPNSSHEALLGLSTDSKRRTARKKDSDALWKVTAESIIADPNADEEDYQQLFEQMERSGASAEDQPSSEAHDRLIKHAYSRHAGQMLHRNTALSQDEASAAERLARAMAALGGDDFGTYSSMAKSIKPRPRGDHPAGYPASGGAR